MAQASTPSLFDRTVAQLRDVWRDLSLRAWPGGGGNGFRPNLPDDDAARLRPADRRMRRQPRRRGLGAGAGGGDRPRLCRRWRPRAGAVPVLLAKDFAAERDAVDKAIVSYRQAKDRVQIAAAEDDAAGRAASRRGCGC